MSSIQILPQMGNVTTMPICLHFLAPRKRPIPEIGFLRGDNCQLTQVLKFSEQCPRLGGKIGETWQSWSWIDLTKVLLLLQVVLSQLVHLLSPATVTLWQVTQAGGDPSQKISVRVAYQPAISQPASTICAVSPALILRPLWRHHTQTKTQAMSFKRLA